MATASFYPAHHITVGEGGCVFLDLTSVPEDLWKIESAGLFALNLFRDFDWKQKPVRIAPCAEKSCGGVTINERAETNLKVLYAGGVVANGSSMPFCLVTGVLAGLHAGKYAYEMGIYKQTLNIEARVRDMENEIQKILKRAHDEQGDPRGIKAKIKSIMMTHVGVLKTQKGLETALDQLRQIREEGLPKIYAEGLRGVREAFEAMKASAAGPH